MAVYNILYLQEMDMVLGIGVLVRDVLDADADLTRFVEKLRVLIFRVDRVLEETVFHQSEELERTMYRSTLDRARSSISQTQSRLKNMGIAGKISVNLPFDKTKANLKQSIEQLQKASLQLKQRQFSISSIKREVKHLQKMSRFQEKQEQKQEKQSKNTKDIEASKAPVQIRFDPTLIEEAPSPQMLATLEQNDDIGGRWIEIGVQLSAPQQLTDFLKSEKNVHQLQKTCFRIQLEPNMKTYQILNFNRKYFKSIYEKARKAIVEIDFISSKKDHFTLTFMYSPKQNVDNPSVEDILVSAAKGCLSHKKKEVQDSQIINSFQQQQFFSFPDRILEQCLSEINVSQYNLMLKNYFKDGTYIRRACQNQWELVTDEIILHNGDQICPIMKKPQKINPAFILKVSLQQILL